MPFVEQNGEFFVPADIDPDAPPAVGRHRVVCEHVEKKTSANGNDYIGMRWRVVDGPDANKAIFHNAFFEGAGSFVNLYVEMCKAVGCYGNPMFPISGFIGEEADVLVEHETYKEQMQARIRKFYLPDDYTEPTKSDDSETKEPVAAGGRKANQPW